MTKMAIVGAGLIGRAWATVFSSHGFEVALHDQTADILAQIDAILAEAGTDKTKLLSASIWLTDMGTFGDMNAVWDSWVAPGCTPARATVEAKLATAEYKVEIAVIAAR